MDNQKIISKVDERRNRAFYYSCVQLVFLKTYYVSTTVLSGMDLTANKACKIPAPSQFSRKRLGHAIR